jgi:VCBS repeat-containing protein
MTMRMPRLAALFAMFLFCTAGFARERSVRQVYPPVAQSDFFSVARGGTLSTPAPGVIANDSRRAPGASRAILLTGPSHGTLTLRFDGSFTYLNDGSAATVDSFTYRINDGHFDSNIANVNIGIVTAVVAPVAGADHYAVKNGGTLTVGSPGILTNDSDSQGNVLFASLVSAPTKGTLTLSADGSFVYTHNGTGTTSDSFTYRATNGVTQSPVATVSISVTANNTAPSGTNDSYSVGRGGVVSVPAPGVLANDTDVEGSTLTAAIATDPAHGSIFLSPNGALVYQHDGSATASDSFTYRANDGQADSAPVTVNIAVTNAAPVASNNVYSVNKGGTLNVALPGVLDNDFDANGDALHATLVANVTHGTLTLNANGSFTYVHDNGSLTSDSFTYKANDGLTDSNVATVTINIVALPQPVVAQNDAYSIVRGGTLNVGAPGVLGNDFDPQNNPLMASVLAGPTHGTLTLNADGSFVYGNDNSSATSDSFTYRASNGFGSPVTATVHLTITASNQPPLANGDVYAVTRGQALNINAPGLLGNDSDPEGATLTAHVVTGPFHGIVSISSDGSFTYVNDGNVATTDSFTYAANDGQTDSAPATVTINVKAAIAAPTAVANTYSVSAGGFLNINAPGILGNDTDPQNSPLTAVLVSTTTHGALSLNSDGSFTYQNANDGATTDSFTYKADNGALQSSAATVTINLGASKNPVAATPDTYSVVRAGQLNVPAPGVLANDTGDTNPLSASTVSSPTHGALTLNSDGSFVYQNDGSATASDSFTYKASDGVTSANATATISITASNQPPAAAPDTYTVAQGGTLTITPPGVLANDTDPEANPLHAVQVTTPAHGSVTLNANGSFTYINDGLSAAADSFTYKANDGTADSNVVTVAITVTAVNHPPVATNDSYSVNQNAALTVAAPGLLANDSDSDGNALTAIVVSNPTHGVLALNANGGFTYTPAAGYFGPDSFTYKANDGTADSNNATVSINVVQVVPPNGPPFANPDAVSTNEDATLTVAAKGVLANDTDPENDPLFANPVVSTTTQGTLTLQNNGAFTYVPNANFFGTDSFTYTATDGAHDSNIATVTITVNAINDVPSFTKGADQTVLEDAGPVIVPNWATAISAGPLEAAQTVHFNVVGNTNAGLFSAAPAVSASGTLTYTPAVNANGTATITINIQDDGGIANGGVDTSATQTFVINVSAVNDVPSFTKGADQAVFEDAGLQTVAGWATALSAGPADESGQVLNFIVSNNNNALFSAQPVIAANGTLTYTPATNVNGVATVSVQIHDNGGVANGGVDTSAVQTFIITVNGVNDVPSFTKGADQTVLEDAAAQTVNGWATAISAGPNEGAQTVHFNITGNTNAALFSAGPAIGPTGTLTFTPAANANGTATITLNIQDDGGTANGGVDTSATQTFVINVTSVNDVPIFTNGADQTVLEDSATATVNPWATGFTAGPPDESGQVLNFIVTNDNNALFSAQPALSPTGVLTFTPAANAFGSATVSVQLHDNGGVANGGVDTSAIHTFTITLTGVNDVPNFTKGLDQAVIEDAGVQTVNGWATAISAGPNEGSQIVHFNVSNNNTTLFSVQPAVSASGVLTYTPAANANGTALVTINIQDDGGTTNGGVDTSANQTFSIFVNPVNDVPSFTKGVDQSSAEDAGAQTVVGFATAISAGPADEAGQAVNFIVSNDNNAIFSVQPAIAANGTLTYTAALNANGLATVTVQIHDNGGTANGGVDTSASQTFTITITGVNDAPVNSVPAAQSLLEDTPLTFSAANLNPISTSDLDAGTSSIAVTLTAVNGIVTLPSTTGLTFAAGTNGSATFKVTGTISAINAALDGLVFMPSPDFNGAASLNILSDDQGNTGSGGALTDSDTINITVTAVNDVPSFTRGADQTVLEDSGVTTVNGWATALSAGPADEAGQVLNFIVTNDNNALFSVQPAVSATGVLTFTPAANAFGTTTVSVQIHDNGGTANGGVDTSAIQTFTISVNNVNDVPSFTKGADQTVLEDAAAQSVNGWATAINAGPNEGSQIVHFNVSNNNNALFSVQPAVSAAGVLTYTLAPNANGTALVTINIQDDGGTANGGVDISADQTFNINVTAVNDVPSFTKGADQTVLEDSGAATVNGWATALSAGPADEAGQTLNFIVTNNNNALFSVQPSVSATGVLTYTPAANAFGTATVSVQIHDNGGIANSGVDTSAIQTFSINVTAVNDVPSFTKGADQNLLEDAAPQSVNPFATAISAGANEGSQIVHFNVSNNNNALFSVQPAVSAAGVLTYTLAANASGTALVTINIQDDGGTANGGVDISADQTFNINVTAVNDVPSFTKGADQTVLEDSGAATINGWATALSAGPADEAGQALNFIVTNNNNALFSAQPSVSAAGVLTYTPAANAFGSATVSVQIHDNGGTASGGVDTSAIQTFNINVTAVNDAPSFTKGADQNVLEDAAPQSVNPWATAISAGANEGSQVVHFNVSNNNNALFSVQPAVSAAGVLTYTLTPDASGTATVTINIQDDGGTANGGVDISADQTFDINVTAVNDAPVAAADTYSTNEDTTLTVNAASGVLANDTDIDTPHGSLTAIQVIGPAHASSFTLNADGSFTYTPNANFNGSDSFTYKANDGALDSNTVTVSITINAINDAPVAVNDSASVLAGQTVAASAPGVLANDTDVENDPLTAAIVTGPTHASSFTFFADGSYSYTHNNDSATSDTFTYKANDGSLDSNVATVTINIQHNQSPTAVADSYSVNRNGSLSKTAVNGVLANDTDPENDALTAIKVSDPTHGTVTTFNADGSFTYTPTPGYAGSDSFTYKANDTFSDSNVATVTITVVNSAPTPGGDSYATVGNTRLQVGSASGNVEVVVAGSVLGNDTDPDGDTLTVSSVTGTTTAAVSGATTVATTHGSVTINPNGTFAYFPAAGYTGADSFTYLASDGVATASATVNLSATGKVWYVRNITAGTTGTSDDPFQLVPSAQTASGVGDFIYIYSGNGVTTPGADTGLTLKNNQTLLGANLASGNFVVGTITITAPTGSAPLLGNTAGAALTLANTNTIRGMKFTTTTAANPAISGTSLTTGPTIDTVNIPSSTGAGISITSSATITTSLTNVTINGTAGAALSGTNFGTITVNGGCSLSGATAIDLDTGTLNTVTPFTSVTSTGGTNGVRLNAIAGTIDASAGNLTGASGTLFLVSGGSTFSSNWGTLLQETNNASMLTITSHSTGTITFSRNMAANNGSGFAFTSANGTYNFTQAGGGDNLNFNGGTAHIDITTSTGTFSFGSNSSINTNSTLFNVSGGTPNITYAGTLTQINANPAVSIANDAGGTITFSGAVSANHGGGAVGVSLSSNTGATIAFTGGLSLTTATSTAFSATSGGTVTVTGSTNTISTSSGSAIIMNGVAIGAAGMTFQTVTTSGAINSALSLTGVSGTLTMNGGTIVGGSAAALVLISGGTLSMTAAQSITQTNAQATVSVTNHSTGTLTFSGVVQATTGSGLNFDNADGTYNFSANDNLNGGSAAITIINGSAGSFTFSSMAVINPTVSNFQVLNSTAAVTYTGALAQTVNNVALMTVQNHTTGTLSFQSGGTWSVSNGTGLQFDNADGTYNILSTSGFLQFTGGDAGIDIINGSGGTFVFGSAGTHASISNLSGIGFNFDSSTANVTYNGDINKGLNNNSAVSISNQASGTIAFTNGTITKGSGGTGAGVNLSNADGTVTFASVSLSGSNNGVDVVNGSSGSFTFTAGSITSPSGISFNVNGSAPAALTYSGSISATNTGSSITVTNAAAAACGTLTFNGSIVASGTGTGILVNNCNSGTIDFSQPTAVGAKSLSTSTGTAVNLTNNAGSTITFGPGLAITTSGGGTGFIASGGGTITLGGSINSAGSPALILNGVTLANSAQTLSSVTSGGAGNGVSFTSVTPAGGSTSLAISAGSIGGNTVAFGLTNSPINITHSGNTTSAGRDVLITNTSANPCGNVTFNGAGANQIIGSTATASGILVNNCNSGTITFGNTTKLINTSAGSNNAVTLTNNAGATINFSNGGLALTTSSGKAFTATGGGTVTVTTGTNNNTLTSTTGTALEITSTTIGASGVTFKSISANGGSNGIVLNTTGNNAGLTILGDGTNAKNGTGGTIQNMTGADGAIAGNGIYLNSTKSPSIRQMNLHDFQNYAVVGTTVAGFTMDYCVVNGTNGTNQSGIGEGAVYFTDLTGSASVTNDDFSGSAYDTFHVFNTGGTLNRITIDTCTFAMTNTGGSDALTFQGTGGTFNATVNNSTITSARGDLFQFNLLGALSADLVFTGNTLSNNNANIVSGGGGVTIGGGGPTNSVNFTYNISGNSIRGAQGAVLAVSEGTGTGNFSGTINNNVIGVSGSAASGSTQGEGIAVYQDGAGSSTVSITNNQVYGVVATRGAIDLLNHNGSGSQMTATITGNTIGTLDQANSFAAMYLQTGSGTGAGGDNNKSCFTISNNAMDLGGNAGGAILAGIAIEQEGVSRVGILGTPSNYGGAAYDFSAVETYVTGKANTVTNANGSQAVFVFGDAATPAGGGYFGACPP